MFRQAILLMASVSAFAQFPGGMLPGPVMPAANYQALKQALGLTDAQVQQLADLQKHRQDAMQTVYRQISDKQRQLNEAVMAAKPDPAAIGQMEIDMANLRKQMGTAPSIKDEAMAVLNSEQKAKLAELEKALQLQRAANEAVGLGLISAPAPVVSPIRALGR